MNGIALLPLLLIVGGWLAAQVLYDLGYLFRGDR